MPRPRKWRNVCCLPQNDQYGPLHQIIDHLELTQEECATQMNVARTTVQAMYLSARKKNRRIHQYGKHLDEQE